MSAPEFLTVEEVEALHSEQLRLFGGLEGLRDRGALESAVAVPTATFGGEFLHVGLFAMAAAYAFHIAENQPFVDGNKRTALNAALVFLGINGWEVDDPDGALYDAMIGISEGTMSK
ncbi:MAG TPA: type II toxin-antitoxin system death-on-curing family toxin, partial [Polyangiaceae bacterium]|nr:type II toxin-antitoxin system death-on-curing family toxin [Polyangiaceae bacterium]